jgi:hypothetical protein
MERSEQLADLATALCAAQAEIKIAAKDAVNPHFRSKYADLAGVWEACRKALHKHGLSVSQFAEPGNEGHLLLTTLLLHKSGQYLGGTALIPLVKSDPQAYGSALTYGRRYGLAALVGVVADEDDDGNAASGRGYDRPQQSRPQQGNAYSYETGVKTPEPTVTEPEDLTLNGRDGLFCSNDECGIPLTPGQHAISVKNFGAGFCPRCQKGRARL